MDPEELIAQAIAAGGVEVMPSATFKIFTGLLRAWETPDGKKRLKGVASSTTKDLHGDTMLESALVDMERDANDNLTIFLNHSYNVPEDVAGSVVSARMVKRGVDGDGEVNHDLDYEVEIDETNDRAVKAWRSIQSGTKLGFSIGAMIPEGGAVRDKKSGALSIAHVKLLETSIVSIPANPRSWIDRNTGASKALLKAWREKGATAQTHQLGSPMLELSGDQYTIRGSLNGLQLGSPEPDLAAAGAPDPDVQDSRVRIIEIDTEDKPKGGSDAGDSPSQEGSEADPEAEEEDWSEVPTTTASAEPDVELATQIEAMGPVLRDAFLAMGQQMQRSATALTQALLDLEVERAARGEAERTRDEVIRHAGQAMVQMQTLVQRLADTPVGRKASFRTIQSDLDEIAAKGIYSESFLKLAVGR